MPSHSLLWFALMLGLPLLVFHNILPAGGASNSVNIFPPASKPYGLTNIEHIKNFWKWILAIPANENPINDATGEKCGIDQAETNSSVFYLAFNNGGKSERTCKVAAGKGLFIPVMQVEISKKDLPNASVEDLMANTKADQDSVNSLYLKIDDKELKYEDLVKYRTSTGVFPLVMANNAIFGIVEGGNTTASADGFYVITEPLAKGNHTINFRSSLICSDPDCADPNFAQDIKYNIIAE
jgi:hypothetical protein